MFQLARSAEDLRLRIKSSPFSLRRIASEAKVSDSTVRRFLHEGAVNVKIAERIEVALQDLARDRGGVGSDVVQ